MAKDLGPTASNVHQLRDRMDQGETGEKVYFPRSRGRVAWDRRRSCGSVSHPSQARLGCRFRSQGRGIRGAATAGMGPRFAVYIGLIVLLALAFVASAAWSCSIDERAGHVSGKRGSLSNRCRPAVRDRPRRFSSTASCSTGAAMAQYGDQRRLPARQRRQPRVQHLARRPVSRRHLCLRRGGTLVAASLFINSALADDRADAELAYASCLLVGLRTKFVAGNSGRYCTTGSHFLTPLI